jgi:hypothetical protein
MQKTLFLVLLAFSLSIPTIAVADRPNIGSIIPAIGTTVSYQTLVNVYANISDADDDLRYILFNLTDTTGIQINVWEKQFTSNQSYYILERIVEGLSPGTKYFFNIAAKDYYGNWTNATYHFFTSGSSSSGSTGDNITIIPAIPRAGKKCYLFDK